MVESESDHICSPVLALRGQQQAWKKRILAQAVVGDAVHWEHETVRFLLHPLFAVSAIQQQSSLHTLGEKLMQVGGW